jgi:outer membrane protein insertion porin family
LFAICVAICGVPAVSLAQGIVRDITIDGNQRIEAETIRSYMVIAPGDVYDEDRIDRSLKALYATGLFRDVTTRRQGDVLVVRVVENPIINRLAFEGNNKLNEETLLKEVQLRPRQVYSVSKVQSDLQRILQLYRRSGRFAATVEPKVIQLPQNRVDLVFEITEGAATQIEKIRFIGNTQYSDSRLREAIATKETAWWRVLSSDDTYDPDRLAFDREQLRRFYLAHGYADFRVVSAVAELTPNREAFFITFTIEEGERYKFGKLDINSSLPGLTDTTELKEAVTATEGDTFDGEKVESTVQNLTTELGRLGYAFVDVKPEPRKRAGERIIDLTFRIDEGPRVYVERINISGNVRTLDKVIRREFRLAEGDAFNTAKIRRSRTRLRGLGFFETVDVAEARGSAPDKAVLDVKVQERSTGEFSIGAGFSTSESVLGDIGLRERNFLGRGQDVKVNLTVSARRQQIDHSFTEPYFLDRELAAGYDLLHRRQNLQRRSGFDQTTSRGAVRFGFPITEHLSTNNGYALRQDTIENIASTASSAIRRQEGTTVTSSVFYGLTYDQLDDRLDPTSGYIARFNQEFGGFGGTEHFVSSIVRYTHYFPLGDQYVLSGGIETGYVRGVADDVNLVNRFFVGGDNFRGFKSGGVGARDPIDGAALGANMYYTGTVELQLPLGLPKELGMTGRVFNVLGSAHEVDEPGTVLESSALRAAAGVGVSWKSPLGPIRLDLAVPYLKEGFDQKEFFRFNFGTRF